MQPTVEKSRNKTTYNNDGDKYSICLADTRLENTITLCIFKDIDTTDEKLCCCKLYSQGDLLYINKYFNECQELKRWYAKE